MIGHSAVVLDACVCINLAAALDAPAKILLNCRAVVVPQVISEALYLHNDGQDDIKTPASLDGLPVAELSDSELPLYLELAERLDDGEAASLALAISRSWTFATDDRSARNTGRRRTPPVDVVTTPRLLRLHAEAAHWDATNVKQAIQAVRRQASFEPPRDDPDYSWWIGNA